MGRNGICVWGGMGYVYGEERDMCMGRKGICVWGGMGYMHGEEWDMCMCMGKNGVTS